MIEVMLKITEYEFGDILLNSTEIQKLIKTKSFLVAREFKVDSAVPDFVLISSVDYKNIVELSKKYPPELFRGLNASIICMLYGPSRTKYISDIAKANFTDEKSVLKSARRLDELNIISFDDKRMTITRSKDFNLPKIDVVSLELKLDKWKKALWQASRNRAYYAKSYVVMPSDKEELIRQNLNHFSVSGVSAVVVDTNGGGVKFVGTKSNRDYSPKLTTQRLAGLSYLMQSYQNFTEFALN
jgi:hypothetical protein